MLNKPFLIDGVWGASSGTRTAAVLDPSNGRQVGELGLAEIPDLDAALRAADRGFDAWRRTTALERSRVLHRAAGLLRERTAHVAELITREQGKPLAEARAEAGTAPEHIEWYAEEARRAYGRVIPSRISGARQLVLREPVGPVAAFSPWNFPVAQLVRKIAGALAAGCSIVAKPPEECPSACIELARAFNDAGLPPGVVNIVFGVPQEVSTHLIASPTIRKVSFTGSVPVGRHLGALAAAQLKRSTMELGGHAPFIVADDVDVEAVARLGVGLKFRNAGQVCASPTRFYVHEGVYDRFRKAFVAGARALKVGPGGDEAHQMGPLANVRRVDSVQGFVEDAVARGAHLECGGRRLGNEGFFFEPTVLSDVPSDARVMNEEPFGPVAALVPVESLEEAVERANGLPYGLAAFGFARSTTAASYLVDHLESGMVSINHFGLAAAETPFGGIKDSGWGSEGGSEGLDAYLTAKFVSQVAA